MQLFRCKFMNFLHNFTCKFSISKSTVIKAFLLYFSMKIRIVALWLWLSFWDEVLAVFDYHCCYASFWFRIEHNRESLAHGCIKFAAWFELGSEFRKLKLSTRFGKVWKYVTSDVGAVSAKTRGGKPVGTSSWSGDTAISPSSQSGLGKFETQNLKCSFLGKPSSFRVTLTLTACDRSGA